MKVRFRRDGFRPDAAEILFRTLGLEPDKPAVVYSSSGPLTTCGNFIGDGLEQTMVAYTLSPVRASESVSP